MPTLRAMFWRVANCARKSAQREPGGASSGPEPVHEPVPVPDLGSASSRIGPEERCSRSWLVVRLKGKWAGGPAEDGMFGRRCSCSCR